MSVAYSRIDPADIPAPLMLLASVLLARLGGQVTITADELSGVAQFYVGIRIAADIQANTVVLTLRTSLELE